VEGGLIARILIPPEAVAKAVGAAQAADAEPRLVPGARASLFHAFRVERGGPARPERVQVFPYADAEWQARAREAAALDVACWRAWWTRVRAERDGAVWAVAPIPGKVEDAVRIVEVEVGGVSLPGWTRPWLEWPDVGRAGLPTDRLGSLWSSFRGVGARIGEATGRDLVLPADVSGLGESRRRVLTDGRRIAVTTWRAFDPRLRDVEERRPRT
jgi:hypothetical protein